MADESNPDESAIAEFHRAARRRKAVVFAVAGLVALVGGIGAIVLSVIAGGEIDTVTRTGPRYEARTILLGIALVAAGGWMCWNAFRLGSGRINDV